MTQTAAWPLSWGSTATTTDASASAAPTRRVTVIALGATVPMPRESITSPLIVWPATVATVKSAIPRRPTTRPCDSTKSPPATPPAACHHGISPRRIAPVTVANPRRPARDATSTIAMMTRPEPNEMKAAMNPSWRSVPSCPLMRDCSATADPQSVASATQRASLSLDAGAGVAVLSVMVLGSNATGSHSMPGPALACWRDDRQQRGPYQAARRERARVAAVGAPAIGRLAGCYASLAQW